MKTSLSFSVLLTALCLSIPLAAQPPAPRAPGIQRPGTQPDRPRTTPAAPIQVPEALEAAANEEAEPGRPRELITPRWRSVSLDLILEEYAQRTGKVILKDPRVSNITVTLESRAAIPEDELLQAIESLLAMNNISLVPFRDNFIKVVPSDSVARSGIELNLGDPDALLDEDGVISQLVELRFLEFGEVQSLITERLSPTAKVQQIDRANAVLITDSRNNIRRIMEILRLIDRPAELREEVKIYEIVHASASEIKGRLEELIAESQADLQRQSTPDRGRTVPRAPPGVIRPGGAQTTRPSPPEQPSATGDVAVSPGLIRGKVQMVADDRTNILLIISRPENDKFFSEMIETLDKKVDPEITVRIYNLQFADAQEVAATLNDLIGAAGREDRPGARSGAEGTDAETRAGQSIRDFIEQRSRERDAAATDPGARSGNVGELSQNTRILADQRTNALLLMGRNADLDVIEGIIKKLDIMLSQVLVRAIIMEVNLNDNFSYGIDWLQRSLTVNNLQTIDGVPIREPVMSFGGGQNLSGSSTTFRDGATIDRDVSLSPGSLSYFASFYDFNLDAVLRFAEGRSDTKVIATPIIMTTDNTEANIRVGERRAVPTTSATTIGGSLQTQFEFINIGIDLTVTPRINPQGVVIMEINQSTEDIGGVSRIDGNDVPNINSRQLNASLAIPNGGTLVLGGLVRDNERESITQVPLLGSIPILGALFRNKSSEKVRTELLVLISPEVILSAEEADVLTRQLKSATELGDSTWHRGWSPRGSEAPGADGLQPLLP